MCVGRGEKTERVASQANVTGPPILVLTGCSLHLNRRVGFDTWRERSAPSDLYGPERSRRLTQSRTRSRGRPSPRTRNREGRNPPTFIGPSRSRGRLDHRERGATLGPRPLLLVVFVIESGQRALGPQGPAEVWRTRLRTSGGGSAPLRKLDPDGRRRIQAAIELLAEDPLPRAATSSAVQERGVCTGNCRVIYEIHDGDLFALVFRMAHRREVPISEQLGVQLAPAQ